MLAALFGRILSWLAGKGFLIAVQQALEAVREERIRRDYEEALKENAVFDALARERAGADLTRERMRDADVDSDPGVLRELLRARDPKTK